MKFNYQLRRLCGSYYGYSRPTTGAASWSGSNVVFHQDNLFSAVSNRVQVLDCRDGSVRTLTVQARSNIKLLAVHGVLLVVVDVQNYILLIQHHKSVVLHRFKAQHSVKCLRFSPSGRYLAIGSGKFLQVWQLPHGQQLREFAPLHLHRTFTGVTDSILDIHWHADETVLMASCQDTTVRIWTLHTVPHFTPITLSGHKSAVVGVYVDRTVENSGSIYTVSSDGCVVTWKVQYATTTVQRADDPEDERLLQEQEESDPANQDAASLLDTETTAHSLVGATYTVHARHYFHQGSNVASCCYRNNLLVVGFESGVFGIYELPDLSNIHTLSVGANQKVQACTLNNSAEWLALACPASQQLLVWEWRSETYVLKQRGHAYGMTCMEYSPDGVCLASGGEDGKIKVWNALSGFCYVTFEKSHTAKVTQVCFANASVIVSCSLDGTVKCHDLHRYRTFKTLTTPNPVQFLSLAVDGAGEIVVAGSMDPFHVYVWNLQTAKLLDVLTGHSGPVCDLAFSNGAGMVVSASWDGTVKTWDLYKTNTSMENFQHSTDVVCVAFRPDGKEICTGTIGGLLSFWNVETGRLLHEIDGRNDIAGGRKMNDRMTANNNAGSRYFTSVCYSADGTCVLAGGNSKVVCIYEVKQQILLKKFQISYNRSLDGVLDELNSKLLGDGGPVDEEADSGDETTYNAIRLPGSSRGDDGSRSSKVEVLSRQVRFSPTGREWAVVSGEGLHIYSLDDDMIFDPISLTEDITPAAVLSKLTAGEYSLALRMALHLNEYGMVKSVLEQTPFSSISHVVRSVGPEQLEHLLQFVAAVASESPHIEFYLQWCLELLQTHGMHMDRHRGTFMRAFRVMHKALATKHDEVKTICNENRYLLDVVKDQGTMALHSVSPEADASS